MQGNVAQRNREPPFLKKQEIYANYPFDLLQEKGFKMNCLVREGGLYESLLGQGGYGKVHKVLLVKM